MIQHSWTFFKISDKYQPWAVVFLVVLWLFPLFAVSQPEVATVSDISPDPENTAVEITDKPVPISTVVEPVETVVAKANDPTDDEESKAGLKRKKSAIIVSSPVVANLPQAKSVELNEPVAVPPVIGQENAIAPVVEGMPESGEEELEQLPAVDAGELSEAVKPLIILGTEVLPSTSTRLSWSPSQSFEGISTPTPVLIVNGAKPGPVLCLTAALHGDELNGIEIVRRVLYNLQPEDLVGSVIGVPIVNLQGFRRNSRYLTDRRDLNRYFPGNPKGSSASRIAYSFFTEVIRHCDALVDLHTGSFYRTNLPQLRADVSNAKVDEIAQSFGSTVVLQSGGALGTLRRAAVDAGIPAVTLEAGESMSLQEKAVEHGVKGIHTLMKKLGMTKKFSLWGDPEPVYYQSIWVRADLGGILFSDVELGAKVNAGDVLGVVTDPITNIKSNIITTRPGRVIGMALNQVVLPGFAAFHIGIRAPADEIVVPESTDHTAASAIDELGQPGNKQSPLMNMLAPVLTEAELNNEEDPDLPVVENDQQDIIGEPAGVDQYD